MDHIYGVKHSQCFDESSFTLRFEMGCTNFRRRLDSLSSHSSVGSFGSRHECFVVSLPRWTFFGSRVFVKIRVEKSHESLEQKGIKGAGACVSIESPSFILEPRVVAG